MTTTSAAVLLRSRPSSAPGGQRVRGALLLIEPPTEDTP